ncbi:unnamed protein product [Miscanthus lutarioriparius]|uniref:Uncharacterized protein n=1 Tax=Miscanthus lutarioriparius TaxID=422564 RepID=A0A811QHW3_9POAL|nr:unnamed protein product [Miscanthus lutarioriparius]
MDGDEENIGPFRRTSARTRRMATRMASALASSDNRSQAALARLEALESDNAGVEVVELNDDEYGSTDEEDLVLMQKKQSRIMKRKTRQGKSLEKRTARSFMDVLQEEWVGKVSDRKPFSPAVHCSCKTTRVLINGSS